MKERIYVRWSSDGQHIRKWSREPFQNGQPLDAVSAPTAPATAELAGWPADWRRNGYNGAITQAAKALRFLATNDRPIGGEEFPNAASCYMIAEELELTRHIFAALAESPAIAKSVADTARLDFLDRCSNRLNERFGTDYRWRLVLNSNVNRLMLHDVRSVDLSDMDPNGLPSCRSAIDEEMARLGFDRPQGADVERDDAGEAMVCAGCGSTQTLAAIRAAAPSAVACCPERKMIAARTIWEGYCASLRGGAAPDKPAAVVAVPAEPELDRCPHCAKWGQEQLRFPDGKWRVVCHPCGSTGPAGETAGEAGRLWNDRPDPQRYALGLLTEEAGEVLQLVGKALRFGLDAKRRDGECARSLLPIETGDLAAALRFGELAALWDADDSATRSQVKLRKLLDPSSVDDEGRRLAPDLGWRAGTVFEELSHG